MSKLLVTNVGRLALVAAVLVMPLSACHAEKGETQYEAGQATTNDAATQETTGAAEAAAGKEDSKVIKDGSQVSIEYTLKLTDGTLVDSNEGKEPLVYTQGGGQILPALELQLAGLSVSDTKNVRLTAAEGYGEVDPAGYQEVEVERVPEDARQVGSLLIAGGPNGEQRPIRVHEVLDDKIILDFNHPLAGQALVFDVTIVGID